MTTPHDDIGDIVVTYMDPGCTVTHSRVFQGRWLLEPGTVRGDDDEEEDPWVRYSEYKYGAVVTSRGRIAVHVEPVDEGFPPGLFDYDRLEDAENEVPDNVLELVAAELGEQWPFRLNI